jgi:hypothetical protein
VQPLMHFERDVLLALLFAALACHRPPHPTGDIRVERHRIERKAGV